MSRASSIRYCRVPAYFIPVMVSLAEDAGPRDALEEATAALVGLGRGLPHELAQILCVASELIESALCELERRQMVRRPDADGPYVVSEQVGSDSRPRERPGYVLWDLLSDLPSFQLIVGKPHEEPYVPDGIDLVDVKVGKPKRRPNLRVVDRAVRSLPDIPDLRVLVPLGHSYRSVDSARIQRITFASRRHLLAGYAFVPIEFRPQCDPIVWRPVVVPSSTLETSLDPEGYGGLKRRLPDTARELDRVRMELDPKLIELLAAEGYSSAEELFKDAERRVQRDLVGAWGNPGWEEIQQAAIEAMRQTILSRFLRSSLLGGMHAWADVLERAMGTLVSTLTQGMSYQAWCQLDKETFQRSLAANSRAVGTIKDKLLRSEDIKPGKKEGLIKALEKGTLGSKLVALVALWLGEPKVTRQMNPVLRTMPDFFRRVASAIDMRNRVIHPGDAESPNARALRGAVLELVKAMMEVL